MYLPRRALAIAGASVVLLGVGTAAGATIAARPVSRGVIHGCYVTQSTAGGHALALQDRGTSCPAGETAIQWDKRGPAGPPGPVNIDSGIVAVTNTGTQQDPILSCSFAKESGPDPLSISSPNEGGTCEISGFPADAIPSVTPLDSLAGGEGVSTEYTPGNPLDVGTACPKSCSAGSSDDEFSFLIYDPSS